MEVHMGNQRCINGTLEGGNYSSPVPIIGLYIAGASLVCSLLMLYDIVAGLRARKRWLPCKTFSLNSVTLSLLGISAKIPVDLTTGMPSAMDQLSKLTGTTLICVAMVFILPSLGGQSRSELRSNMAALAIFVITVFVNICIQISTGVIVLFIPEHIIIMIFMLVLVAKMWGFFPFVSFRSSCVDENCSLLKTGKGTLLHRLKVCYVKAYRSSTQFMVCYHSICAGFSGISLLCSVTLIQAVFRSVIFKQLDFCSGNSDYDWSMRLIVFSQIWAVVVGSSATTFRWLSVYQILDRKKEDAPPDSVSKMMNRMGYECSCFCCMGCGPILLLLPFMWLFWWIPAIIVCLLALLVSCLLKLRSNNDPQVEDFKHQNQDRSADLDTWLLKKRVVQLDHVIARYKEGLQAPTHLINLFSQISPSQQFQVSTKSMLTSTYVIHTYLQVLVGVAEVSLPTSMRSCLSKAYHEAHLLFCFISGKDESTDSKKYRKQLDIIGKPPYESDIDSAIFIITKLRSSFVPDPHDFRRNRKRSMGTELEELDFITQLINETTYYTIEALSSCMKQLFVDLAHALLEQFPNAVFKVLGNGDPFPDNFEKKAQCAVQMMYRAKELDGHIQWSFPVQWNISRLTSPIIQNDEESCC